MVKNIQTQIPLFSINDFSLSLKWFEILLSNIKVLFSHSYMLPNIVIAVKFACKTGSCPCRKFPFFTTPMLSKGNMLFNLASVSKQESPQ